VAKSPPRDCPISVLDPAALYFFSMKGCNSFSINAMNLSECPVVGKAFLSDAMVVG